MSGYDEATRSLETEQQRQKGSEAYLSQEERDQVQRILKYPEEFPRDFGSWIQDYLGVNVPQIPISNVVGFERFENDLEEAQQAIIDSQITASVQRIATQQTVTTDSSPYQNLATVGPSLTGLLDGTYLIFVTCNANVASATYTAFMSPSINGAAALDANAAISTSTTPAGAINIFTAVLSNSDNNSLVAKYRSSNGVINATFSNRVLVALRIGA